MTRQSEEVNHLAAALVAFQAEMTVIPKDSVNPFFKSTYADLAACVKAAMPIHTKHGLAVSQHIGMGYLTTRLWHSSGQWIEEDMDLVTSKDNDPQAQGSAVTYARRYAYCSVLGIVADNDDDGEAASARRKVERHTESAAVLPESREQYYQQVNGESIPLSPEMETTRSGPPSTLASPKQANYAKSLLRGAGLVTTEQLVSWFNINEVGPWPDSANNLTKAQAARVIELLKP